jgi:antitoxin ParD1/3/4
LVRHNENCGTIESMEALMATAQNRIVVDLGSLRKSVEDRIQSGSYASADEVIRAGLLALEREESRTDEWLTRLAEESLADPRPSVPAAQVFRELKAKYGRPAGDSAS